MRIICPYTGEPHPDTRAVLDAWRGPVELVDVSGDDYAYARLLEELWAAGETFLLVEHDIVPTPQTLAELALCDHPYCAAPYPWTTHLGPALGCTRFSSLFVRTYPDAARIAARLPSNFGAPGHWRQLDVRLMQSVLRDRYGWQPHCHRPVEHRNPERQLVAGAVYTHTVDGRSHLPPGLVERVEAELAAERALAGIG